MRSIGGLAGGGSEFMEIDFQNQARSGIREGTYTFSSATSAKKYAPSAVIRRLQCSTLIPRNLLT